MTNKANSSEVTHEQKTVTIERTFDLPLSKVWKAWTDPDTFKKWWGPKDFECTYCTIDLKVGKKTLANMVTPEGVEIWSTGTFREIVPMKKIVYEDNFSDSKGNTVDPSYYKMPGEWHDVQVTLTLEEVNGKTKMTLEQTGIPEEMYDDCIKGWNQSLDKLEDNLK